MLAQIWQILKTDHHAILQALGIHIEISLLALVIAVIIAVPLAIWLTPHKRVAEAMLQVTSVLQTIPSLALLGLLIPFFGIGTVPAVIALVAYAILPIFQNTYAGLTGIDPDLEEAAEAFGLSRFKRLSRIELPLALPLIISGIRIALVMIIGTATLAALIGAGGLGTYIILGIQTNNNGLLFVGALLSALLAIVFSALIRWLGKLPFKKIIGISVILLVGFGSVGAYRAMTASKETLVIAGKLGSEPEILMNMYRDLAKQADPRLQVSVKPNFGGTTFLFKALEANQIQIYPEFTGTVMESLVKTKQARTSHQPAKAYQMAKKLLSQQKQMTYLKPMAYQNNYTILVRPELAKKYNLKKISDLKRITEPIVAGFDPDFYQQKDGYPGLNKAYQLNFKTIKTMEPSLRYQAIADKRVNLVDGYSTDPEIREYHLVALKDDQAFFPPYQGAPLMTNATARKYPKVVKALNRLAGKISAADMQEMNYLVSVKHQKAATVAHNYLKQHGLLDR